MTSLFFHFISHTPYLYIHIYFFLYIVTDFKNGNPSWCTSSSEHFKESQLFNSNLLIKFFCASFYWFNCSHLNLLSKQIVNFETPSIMKFIASTHATYVSMTNTNTKATSKAVNFTEIFPLEKLNGTKVAVTVILWPAAVMTRFPRHFRYVHV